LAVADEDDVDLSGDESPEADLDEDAVDLSGDDSPEADLGEDEEP